MIRHIVFVRFAAGTPEIERQTIFADLTFLRRHVPGMLSFSAGPNISPEGLGRGFTHAFTADFATEADRDAYLVHPAHEAAGARLVRAAENGVDGLTVIDIEVEG